MSHGTASVPLQNFFTLAPQHVPTRGHSWKLVKPHSSTDTRRFFFYVRVSSTNGTVFHKRQLMWTGSRTSWTGSGTAGWVSLWTHSPRNSTRLYNATIQYQTWHHSYSKCLSRHIGAAVPGELMRFCGGNFCRKRFFFFG